MNTQCFQHQKRSALYTCPHCGRGFCYECVIIQSTGNVSLTYCPFCVYPLCDPKSRDRFLPFEQFDTFQSRFLEALRFPVQQGNFVHLLLVGALLWIVFTLSPSGLKYHLVFFILSCYGAITIHSSVSMNASINMDRFGKVFSDGLLFYLVLIFSYIPPAIYFAFFYENLTGSYVLPDSYGLVMIVLSLVITLGVPVYVFPRLIGAVFSSPEFSPGKIHHLSQTILLYDRPSYFKMVSALYAMSIVFFLIMTGHPAVLFSTEHWFTLILNVLAISYIFLVSVRLCGWYIAAFLHDNADILLSQTAYDLLAPQRSEHKAQKPEMSPK